MVVKRSANCWSNSTSAICCSVAQLCLTLCDPMNCGTCARLPCPSPSPGVCSDSCLLNQWCHPTISSFVIPFSSYHQSFPPSGSFPMSRPFESGGQSIGTSASASVLPVNIQSWFPLGLTGLISLQSKRFSKVCSNTRVQKHQSTLWCSAFFMVQLSHLYMTTGKTIAFTIQLCQQSDVSAF